MNFSKPTLNIGVVGSGFMGKTHVYGYAIASIQITSNRNYSRASVSLKCCGYEISTSKGHARGEGHE